MTDFSHARKLKCHVCGESFCDVEGKACDCFQCVECGDWFEGENRGEVQNHADENYCVFCRDQVASRCDGCGEWFLRKELHYTSKVLQETANIISVSSIKFCRECEQGGENEILSD